VLSQGLPVPDRTQLPPASCDLVEVADGVRVFCRFAGRQNPGQPLILLHGNRDNHTHYSELEGLLAADRPTVAVDLRGHGLSTKADWPLSPELFADDLAAIIDHYGWDQVTLVGHSLGATSSMVYALRHPARVRRLVLMGAAAHYELKWKRPPVTEETYPQVIRESNQRATPFFFTERHPDVMRRVIASWSSVPFAVHRNLIRMVHPDLRPRVGELRMPTLIVAGELDRSTTLADARWLHEHIGGSRLTVIPGTGHFMFMEQPAHVAAEIRAFL
jgi:pimeloyl-ACP methyl ester carboxylesterase